MRRWEGVAVLLVTLGCWSSVPLFLKHLANYMDHWTNNGWRYGASALFWLPAVVWAASRGRLPRTIWRAALVPAAFNTAAQVAFTAAHSYVSPGVVTFGLRLQVVFIALGAFVLFPRERATIRRPIYLCGLGLLMAGIVTVLITGSEFAPGTSRFGVWLAVGSGMGYGAYGLAVRRYMYGFHPVLAFGVIALYTGGALVAAMLVMAPDHGASVVHLDAPELWQLAASAILGIAVGHVLYYTAIDRLGVATTAAVLQLQPFIVSAASVPLFGIALSGTQWLGGLVALGGAVLVLRAQRAAERAAQLAAQQAAHQAAERAAAVASTP